MLARTEAKLTSLSDNNEADIVWRSDEDCKAGTIALLKRMRRIAAFCVENLKTAGGTNSVKAKEQFMRLYVGYVKGTAIPDAPAETAAAGREPTAFNADMF